MFYIDQVVPAMVYSTVHVFSCQLLMCLDSADPASRNIVSYNCKYQHEHPVLTITCHIHSAYTSAPRQACWGYWSTDWL